MNNPHIAHLTSPISLVRSFWRNRNLIMQMVLREVIGRYKGSFLGLAWSFVNPILMLIIYTFVFSVIFKARWGLAGGESKSEFAVILFVGLIVHSIFAEVVNNAPGLILCNVNYVKKVVFPLEILPIITMGSALFHGFVSFFVLVAAFIIFHGFLYWTVSLLPFVILPLLFVTLGFAWLLASLGVYLRDVGQIIGIVTTIMLFLAPVFYPISSLPENYQSMLMINPLTFIIEQSRKVVILGQLPDFGGLSIYSSISLIVAWLGYWWFQKTRSGFADVL